MPRTYTRSTVPRAAADGADLKRDGTVADTLCVTTITSDLSAVAPSPSPPPVIRLDGVRKTFGANRALDDLHLTVPGGKITVLLGPNGAGKTTAIRTITGAFSPEVGTVRVFGLDPAVHGEEVRARCGVVSAKPALYDRLSGLDNLRYSAELYGLGRGAAVDARIAESAARFGIEGALSDQVGGYSTGMKTRLALSRSVLHRPDLLLYDEPTSGLDPESSLAVLELIREMTLDGSTVVMCTHLLLEAEGLADQVVILQDGANLVEGSPNALTDRYWPHPMVRLGADDPAALDALADVPGVVGYERADLIAVLRLDAPERVPDLVAALTAGGARVTRVEPHEPTLEDLYFAVRQSAGRSRLGRVDGSSV
jgi:ABC-2 type transport system ATP-binding protein